MRLSPRTIALIEVFAGQNGPIVSETKYDNAPSHLHPTVEDGGYLVLVTWPKGPEQQLDGFGSVEAARAWIEEDGPNWIAGSPYSH